MLTDAGELRAAFFPPSPSPPEDDGLRGIVPDS
jgi:hypothetical protein